MVRKEVMALKLKEVETYFLRRGMPISKNRLDFQLSVSTIAVLIFLGLNFYMIRNQSMVLTGVPKDYIEKNDIWWAFHNYQVLKEQPEIFFLGSSSVKAALLGADQLPFLPSIDRHNHYRSAYFEYQLKRQLKKKYGTCDLAISGSMASDQCMILSTLRKINCSPKVIIYGVTPRDFINNGLFCPASTPTFQYLDQYFKIGELYPDIYDNKKDLLYAVLKKYVYFFRASLMLKNTFTIWWQKQMHSLFPNLGRSSCIEDFSSLKLPSEEQFRNESTPKLPNKSIVYQYIESNKPFLSIDLQFNSLAYSPFPHFIYKQQLYYFQKLISLCKSGGSQLLVVNMPTTLEHQKLLSDRYYQNYLYTIKDMVKRSGYQFIDMNRLETFSCGYFYDSIHLNPIGAKIFINHLIQSLCLTPKCFWNFGDEATHRFRKYLAKIDHLTNYPEQTVPQVVNEPARVSKYLCSWLKEAYFEEHQPPDVMVLGNSQLGPLIGADAYVYNKSIDITGNHRSYLLEQNLQAFLGNKWKVLISAIPNALISDQFIISRSLFSVNKPKLVALAISPLSFIDTFSSPNYTEARCFFSENSCASCNKKDIDFPESISPLVLGEPFKQICSGQVVITSADGYSFNDNAEEYRLRYRNPLSNRFNFQMRYFNILLKYLAEQHIKVVVFNLPLTIANKKLLPTNFWSFYNQQIKKACNQYNADWVDVNKEVKGFGDNEFMDSIHLNLIGGHRLANTMALYIANKFHWKTFVELESCERKML